MDNVASGPLRRFSRRIAPTALGLQCLSVLALPVAFCCCLAMAADHVAHDASHDSQGGTEEACPHHDSGPPTHGPAGDQDEGCRHLDQLVMLLAGLTGVMTPGAEATPGLVVAETVVVPQIAPIPLVRPVEAPPPRA